MTDPTEPRLLVVPADPTAAADQIRARLADLRATTPAAGLAYLEAEASAVRAMVDAGCQAGGLTLGEVRARFLAAAEANRDADVAVHGADQVALEHTAFALALRGRP